MASLTTFSDEARIAFDTVGDRIASLSEPTLRLGVTGLSRSGKTVFIAALVHNLIHGGRLPLFEPAHSGRITKAYLRPQPDDTVPRFQYEDHVRALVDRRIWPDSTRAISQMRLVIDYEPAGAWGSWFSGGKLTLDIVDYPGEWLLDLPLLAKSYREFSAEAIALATGTTRADLSGDWLTATRAADPAAEADESVAQDLAASFTAYLRACRADDRALSTLPPGRFLMPGDLEGSPALTFAPLALDGLPRARAGSLEAMMERRYEAYKAHVVKPFFRDHVARLDRQIVLVDAMQAINAGPGAVVDLERALAEILACFRQGSSNFISSLFSRRIDRILVAATKADHLHHESHDRLEAIVERLVARAADKARFSGAETNVLALAAVRATREGTVEQDGETLPVIIGTPIEGETIGNQTFDGTRETAIFPGDLPADPQSLLDGEGEPVGDDMRFVRFLPPRLDRTLEGVTLSLPHIRLDRALQFLIGDQLA